MAHIRIETDRGDGWRSRSEGDADATAEAVLAQLPAYAANYPSRAFFNGELIGEARPVRGQRYGRLVNVSR